MLRLEQVAGLQDHRFGFVEDRQVEDAGACAHRLVAVDAAQLALDGLDDRVEEFVAHLQHHVQVGEVLGAQHVVDLVEDRFHLVVHAFMLQIPH